MPLEQMMWVEKYRPSKLDDVVNQQAIKQRLKLLIEKKGELPHLLFAGPPGSGKTTTAMIIAKQLLGEHWRDYTLSLNASDERGIDIVRERVKTFARFSDRREGVPFRLVILDECDEMCLHPDTRILVGDLDNLKHATLADLYEQYGEEPFELPTLNPKSMSAENDRGKIVPSGSAGVYRVTFEDGRHVLASAEHPFFVVHGASMRIVRTREITPESELADFGNKFLHCYQCGKIFYRHYPTDLYQHYFCASLCRNSFFGSISRSRTPKERGLIETKRLAGIKRSGFRTSVQYRQLRSEIAKRLILEGKIPDPRTWKKYTKGEGAWLGKRLSEDHKKAIGEGGRKFFQQHPEVRRAASEKLKQSLADEGGAYRKLVRSGFFKQASRSAFLASADYWKKNRFRSKLELKMADLLDKWGIEYDRESVMFTNEAGHHYPLVVDFVIGKVALFVHGCWWHVCPICGVKPDYEKQLRNMEKDRRHISGLQSMGYKVVVVWEHELKDDASVQNEVLPKIYESVAISGGLPRIRHSKVRSVEYVGKHNVLNVSAVNNHNFFLANGILTHNTNDAQTALRRIMEENSTHTRFILVCNYSSGIIEPLQSRCAVFRFLRLDEGAVVTHLKEIASREKLSLGGIGVLEAVYEATQGDLRQAINLMQAASVSGELTLESVKSVTGATVKARVAEIVNRALDGDFAGARTKMVELTRVYGVPERDFLRFANEALGSAKPDDLAKAISILAEYDFRLVQGAQPELQLTAMLAELAALKRKGD
ncbi:MAG: AAA family ATPase [Nitrososphaerales archaeon]|nr:AAA family ATPase [Nitrososphaerales archaeon]